MRQRTEPCNYGICENLDGPFMKKIPNIIFSDAVHHLGPLYLHGLTLIPARISNYIHYKVWDEITYPFLNFNGANVEV